MVSRSMPTSVSSDGNELVVCLFLMDSEERTIQRQSKVALIRGGDWEEEANAGPAG
jgi:hypothetical protein